MGQSTSGTSLTTTAAAAARKVAYRFMVDWEEDGFSDIETWDNTGHGDESAYVKSITGRHEAVSATRSVAPMGRGVSDQIVVVCHNPEESSPNSGLRYSPSNTNGSLYSYIGSGGMYMKRAVVEMGFYTGGTPERLRQITGYIVDFQEDYETRTATFTIRDRAADAALSRRSSALYEGYTAKQYLETLCTLVDRDTIASGDRIFDTGIVVTPYQWLDDESVWDEMGIVAEAQGGRIWFDKDGDLHFDDATHWVKPNTNSYDDPTTSQATFTVASFANLQPQLAFNLIFNHVIVDYQPRYVGPRQAIYSASETIPVHYYTLYSPNYLKMDVSFRYPTIGGGPSVFDYTAVTGGGVDISDDILITHVGYAASCELHITNTNSDEYTAFLAQLNLMGDPLLTEEGGKWEDEDATSISNFGRRTLHIKGNPYIQHRRHAEALGAFALERYKNPRQKLQLHGIPARPWLEVGDRITVTETLTDISEDFFIEEIGWAFDGRRYTMSLDIVAAADMFPYSNYFILGTSTYGTSARYFW